MIKRPLVVIDPQKGDRCKHFTGISSGTCEMGIAYTSVQIDHGPIEYAYHADAKPPHYSITRSFPCYGYNLGGATCDKREVQTPEEIAAEEAELEALMKNTMLARDAIVAHLGKWKKGSPSVGGLIDCPVCKKTQSLRFTRAKCNGHIHGHCDGCVSWME